MHNGNPVNLMDDDVYEVLAVRYASRQTLRSLVYLNHHLYDEPDGPIGMDYFIWIVRNAQRTFVVDTGYSVEGGLARNRGHLIHPAEALTALDVDPDDATVILTHAHYDHAGNLDLFPRSPIITPKTEFDFWTGEMAHRLQFRHSAETRELELLGEIARQGRMTFFEGRSDIAPGIELIELGGHSPGQAIVLVNTEAGTVLLSSDATHYYEEIERDMPFLVVADLEAMYAGFDTMKRIVDERNAILVPGHDPEVMTRFPAHDTADFAVVIAPTPTPSRCVAATQRGADVV